MRSSTADRQSRAAAAARSDTPPVDDDNDEGPRSYVYWAPSHCGHLNWRRRRSPPHPAPPPYSLRLPPARLSFLPSFHRRQRRPRADSGNVVGIKEKRRRRRPCVASPEVCAECGWSKTRPSTHPVANPHACPGEAAAVCLCGPPSVRVAAWQLRLNYARHRAIDPRFEIQTLHLTPAAPRCRCARQQSAILY